MRKAVEKVLDLTQDWRFKVGFSVGFGVALAIIAGAVALTVFGWEVNR